MTGKAPRLRIGRLFGVGLAACLLGCGEAERRSQARADESPSEGKSLDAAAARALTDELATSLKSQLQAAMEAGGPAKAIEVCRNIAMPVTDGVSAKAAGLKVTRVALKNRNPGNAVDARDERILRQWQSAVKQGRQPEARLVDAENGASPRYYRPIMTGAVCVKCHGPRESLDAAVKAALANHYPDDLAHGFKEGDLRGAFRVELVR